MSGRRRSVGRLAGWVAAGLVLLLLVAIPDPREFARAHGARQRLSIATGGTGGVWYPYGGGVATVITRHVRNVEATAEVTGASVDNLKLLGQGSADLAFSLGDVLHDAFHGTGPFADFGRVPVRAVAVLYTQYTHLVTFADRGIDEIGDLRGRIVSVGSPGSGTEALAVRVLAAAGLDPRRDIRARGLGATESVGALRDGKIDAFFWSGGIPTGAVLDLASTPGRRMVLVPTAGLLPELRLRHGGGLYYEAVIPREAYPGLPGDVAVVGTASVLAGDAGMSDDLAYEITRALFEHRDDLVAVHPAARELGIERATRGSPVPFHPGAIRYYRERGAWPPG